MGFAKERAMQEDERVERMQEAAPEMYAALKDVVGDVLDYERVNNLSPSPGKRECWQSVTRALAAIAKAEGRA